MKITSFGYIRVESPHAEEWRTFAPEVLGLEVTADPLGRADHVSLTNDDRPGRITIAQGPQNRLTCLGWEVATAEDLEDAVETLTREGVAFERGTDDERKAAQVRDLLSFVDPAGFRHEVFYGALERPGQFSPGRAVSGFVTGAEGLGHAVIVVPDMQASLDFFKRVFGFKVSDEIDMWGTTVVFFHANPRHHTLAVLSLGGVRGLHHLMFQLNDLDDVGKAYDICLDRQVPIAMTLGRHTNDRMLSFYARTPSGFEFEYGWGARTITDENPWVVTYMEGPSIWGHRPGDAPPPGCIEPLEGAEAV